MSDFALFTAAADGSVVRLGDHFDLFGVSRWQGLVTDREAVDSSMGTLDSILHEEGRWYAGKLQPIASTDADCRRTHHLCSLRLLTEITPVEAASWLYKQMGYLPSRAKEALAAPAVEATEAPAVAPEPREAPAVDFAALASALRKARKPMQAALVEHMADRTEATAEDVAEHVHKDPTTTEKAMRNRADQTNKSLEDMGSLVRFQLASGRMFRAILSE